MAPQRRTAGGLHPGHAAADHQDIFLDRSRRQVKAGFPRRLGIHRAPGSTADLQGPDTTLVAADAGADVLRTSHGDLLRIGRVRQGRTAQHDAVNAALATAWAASQDHSGAPAQRMGILTASFCGLGHGAGPGPFPGSQGGAA